MQVKQIKVDVLIFGGGIAGCWLLHSLRQKGWQAILLQADALGAGQTGKSQGIIHGGVKYALNGLLNHSSQSIANMPKIWEDCLHGRGNINLSAAKILSDAQYLWPYKSMKSRLKTYFASHLLRGRCKLIDKDLYPSLFQHEKFKQPLYSLTESVVDTYSLLEALCSPYRDYILQANTQHSSIKVSQGKIQGVDYAYNGDIFHVIADNYVFTAGEGVESLLGHSLYLDCPMQRRPLRMSIISFDDLQPVYAHCMGKTNTPTLTITSHQNSQGQWLWYVGGEVSEIGASKNANKHENDLLKTLKKSLPWLSFNNFKCHSFLVNRAEAWQSDGKRPALPTIKNQGNLSVVWPTKLAFAPMLPDRLLPFLKKSGGKGRGLQYLNHWPKAEIAKPIWDCLL